MHSSDESSLLRAGFTCCQPVAPDPINRRHLLVGAAGVLTAGMLGSGPIRASCNEYEALVLSCIDPRFQQPVARYLDGRGLAGRYSQVTIAGGAIGVVAKVFEGWHETFWENVKISRDLHHVRRVIVINHRECGAARAAYGDAAVANCAVEKATHRRALAAFATELAARHSELAVETVLMDLQGKVES